MHDLSNAHRYVCKMRIERLNRRTVLEADHNAIFLDGASLDEFSVCSSQYTSSLGTLEVKPAVFTLDLQNWMHPRTKLHSLTLEMLDRGNRRFGLCQDQSRHAHENEQNGWNPHQNLHANG